MRTIEMPSETRASYYAYLYEQLMPIADVATELGVPYCYVREMLQNGEIYGREIATDVWLIPRAEVTRRLAREWSFALRDLVR
jgi:hypothetical protein